MRIRLSALTLLSALCVAWCARAEKPMTMETPFTRSVSRELPLPEYPRPQFERESWVNLNGKWNYTVESCDFEAVQGLTEAESWTTRPIPTAWTGEILVPFSIDAPLSGVGHILRPQEVLWYERRFDVPRDWKDKRVVLHFQASDWETSVYVNGRRVGQHRGGYDPFSFDITDYVRKSGNVLNVCVWDATEQQAQAIGKQIMPEHRQGFRYQPTGGIWQTVWLEGVPRKAIERVKITPQYDDAAVKVEFAKPAGQHVSVEILDNGRVVARAETTDDTAVIPLPGFKPWSPDSPHLYDLEMRLTEGGRTLDKVKSYFGMRKIEVRPDAAGQPLVYLNGREIFQYGPLDQGYWPDGVLTPPGDEAAAFDLEYLKQIGANMIRVHIKTHPDRWYYHADRLGILVWQDMICMPKYGQTVTEAASGQWAAEFKNMVDWLYNHPSVVLWVVFNEAWGQHDTEKHTQWIASYDPSRIVTCASGWFDAPAGNTVDMHDYTFYPRAVPDWKLGRTRAAVLGEAGGVNLAVPGHTWYSETNPPRQKSHDTFTPKSDFSFTTEAGRHTYATSGEFEEAYGKYMRTLRWLRAIGACTGVVYTQITDVEHELNGWMTYDRKVSKIPAEKMRAMNTPLYEKLAVETLLDWGGQWTAGDGTLLTLPAGAENPFVGVAARRELPVTVSNTFTVDDPSRSHCIGVFGMSDYEIRINGRLFRRTKVGGQNYEPSYGVFEIYPDEAGILKKGLNEITVKVLPVKGVKPLFDFAVFCEE